MYKLYIYFNIYHIMLYICYHNYGKRFQLFAVHYSSFNFAFINSVRLIIFVEKNEYFC